MLCLPLAARAEIEGSDFWRKWGAPNRHLVKNIPEINPDYVIEDGEYNVTHNEYMGRFAKVTVLFLETQDRNVAFCDGFL